MTGPFYDDLAATYHLMFADWDASMAYQASALGDVIGPGRVLDCACGIGTQAIGLALRGHEVVGTDLSPVAAARASQEASQRGVRVLTAAADMRALPFRDGEFDVVLAADNALPHLLTPEDVLAALREMRRVLRPGGRLVLTVRDYDAVLADRPLATSPQVGPGRVVTFQLWHWDGDHYDLEHFQLHEGESWRAEVRRTTYWAITRAELTGLVERAGFDYSEWPLTAYYQPVLRATKG
ncbi:class I SAM-dependent methyltransferase [Lentzea tibetensis]|nr:class I SAM-dependent methyltransferase [Lentzea tibetensis]